MLTMNDAHDLLHDADVLVVGERIAAVGPALEVPEGTFEIDASNGIVMPGMIDTHRHMWQTALRGYGADWTLSQYTLPTDGPVGRYLEAIGQHPWRPAHIHFKVTAPGHQTLVTQVLFPDDPYLENDTIGAVKSALVRPLEKRDGHFSCDFDIALAPLEPRAG